MNLEENCTFSLRFGECSFLIEIENESFHINPLILFHSLDHSELSVL